MSSAAQEQKKTLRSAVREERAKLSESEIASSGEAIAEQLKSLVLSAGAHSVTCFLPLPGEPDTTVFIAWAQQQGIKVLLPSAQEDNQLDWVQLSNAGTVQGAFGIDEPVGKRLGPLASAEVDLMIVPAAAIDLSGNRLGWGRGYFDRNLAALENRPPVFAVVHEHELVESLPHDPHDVPVSGVITPERTLRFH